MKQRMTVNKLNTITLFSYMILGCLFGVATSKSFLLTHTDLLFALKAANQQPCLNQLVLVIVPFFFILLSVCLSKFGLLSSILFWKMFSFCFVANMIHFSYGSGGWLIGFFAMFLNSIVVLTMVWFSLRRICHFAEFLQKDLIVCFGLILIASVCEIFLISPFLSRLFTILER